MMSLPCFFGSGNLGYRHMLGQDIENKPGLLDCRREVCRRHYHTPRWGDLEAMVVGIKFFGQWPLTFQ